MIKCPVCSTENIDQAIFCSECGFAFAPPASTPVYSPMPGYPPMTGQIKPGDRTKNWAAILGLILGILAIPCCFIGAPTFLAFSNFSYSSLYLSSAVSGVIGIAGLIFSIIGMKSTKKGMAIGGLCCAIVGLLFAIIFAGMVATEEFREGFYESLRSMGY